jgi:hypothetical protein
MALALSAPKLMAEMLKIDADRACAAIRPAERDAECSSASGVGAIECVIHS